MNVRSYMSALLVAAGICSLTAGSVLAQPTTLIETPELKPLVTAGLLPPVADRAPETPCVVDKPYPDWKPGRHGGEMTWLMSRSKDIRLAVVYGYARLVRFTPEYKFKADILEKIDVREGREFTLTLRKGHKWSDGHPFTTEDFRYFWEDVANNKHLAPLGPPNIMLVEGEAPKVEIIDSRTIRYSWTRPNPDFLPRMAAPRPIFLYRPAHYLKQFHADYADAAALEKLVQKANRRNWANLHNRRDNMDKNDNPRMPSLQPWLINTRPPAERFIFRRNPYFHCIDKAGRQLPYIDRVVMNIAAAQIIPGKTGAGESTLQARYLNFSDYTFLKRGEKRQNYKVRLWKTAKGSHFALYPNLNVQDVAWRRLFRDVRFRRALSLAINRFEINQVVYFGLALEGNNTVLPASPLYKPEYTTKWTKFSLKEANRLLDSIGLTQRNEAGIRLLPDGRPMELIVETPGEDIEQTDVLELIHDSWLAAGIKLYTRPSQREVFRNRIFSGETMMSVWSGLNNALPNADTSPHELAPTSQQQLQWPKWGQYYQSGGRVGFPPNMPRAQELLALYKAWRAVSSTGERQRIWSRMLEIHANQLFTIGVVAAVPQPVVIKNELRNVPKKGIYNWSPGAHFGIYHPEAFWIAREGAEGG